MNDVAKPISTQTNPDNSTPAPAAGAPPTAAPTAAPASTSPAAPTPQAAPQAPAAPQATQAPGAMFKNLSHAFLGAVLGGLAGRPAHTYSVDNDPNSPSYGETRASVPGQTHGDMLRSIAQNALAGLAAGSQVKNTGSGGGNALAGLGAGAQAGMAMKQKQEDRNREEADQSFEQQQRAIMQKSNIAHLNAATLSTYYGNLAVQNDLDPTFKQNRTLVDSINDSPELGHAKVMDAKDVAAQREKDPHFMTDNVVLPLGRKPVVDSEGNPVLDQKGNPMSEMQIAVIPGHDGKLVVPDSLAQDIQKYGERAGITNTDGFKAGMEIPFNKVIPAMAAVQAEKKSELAGWQKAVDVLQSDKDGKPTGVHLQQNPVTGETRPYPAGVSPNEANKALESQAKVADDEAGRAEKAAQIKHLNAETTKTNQDITDHAAVNPTGANGASLSGEDYLKTLPAGTQNVIRAIAEGRETRSSRQLQDKNGNPTVLAQQLHTAYPDFDDKKAAGYGNLVKDFETGDSSKTLTRYGTSMNHLRKMYDAATASSFIPGTKDYTNYHQDLRYVATEVAAALSGGVPTEGGIDEQVRVLSAPTPSLRKEALENAESLLSGKMTELQQRWKDGQVRPSYTPAMPHLSDEAIKSAAYVRNHGQEAEDAGQTIHRVGGIIMQNGHSYVITGVDAQGRVTGATPNTEHPN